MLINKTDPIDTSVASDFVSSLPSDLSKTTVQMIERRTEKLEELLKEKQADLAKATDLASQLKVLLEYDLHINAFLALDTDQLEAHEAYDPALTDAIVKEALAPYAQDLESDLHQYAPSLSDEGKQLMEAILANCKVANPSVSEVKKSANEIINSSSFPTTYPNLPATDLSAIEKATGAKPTGGGSTGNYDQFNQAIANWVNSATGPEKTRREAIASSLDSIMKAHDFEDRGKSFSQFQRFLNSPYQPNVRDIYYAFAQATQGQVPFTPSDIAAICTAANIAPIPADPLDLILCGLQDKICNGNLSDQDKELLQSEISWMTGSNSKKITIDDFGQQIEADPEADCDSILKNLDANGIAALTDVMQAAIPGWIPPAIGYDSFEKDLNAWANFKYTDEASKAVVQEIVTKVMQKMNDMRKDEMPFSEFQKYLSSTDLYLTLSKLTTDDSDNLPVPTDALEAIFRCANLDIMGCQPSDIDRIYTDLLSHMNGGTPGSPLSDDDVAGYQQIATYIQTHPNATLNDVKTFIGTISSTLSDYANQDLQAMLDPEQNPRPYNYPEDTEYFRNDQKILPLHPEDPEYYREHVIPALGVGQYDNHDAIGRYRYVTGKNGEMYISVHYNQFLRVDTLMSEAQKPGGLTQDEVAAWMKQCTDKTSPNYDPHFYKEIQDLGQIVGFNTNDLLSGDPQKIPQILSQMTNLFLTIGANPPPSI